MKPVAVLGSGPSGLFAAYAAAYVGVPVAIFSNGGKSRIGGAQFLHRSIPGIHEDQMKPDIMLTYRVEGDGAGYQKKAYGTLNAPPFVSIDRVKDGLQVPAWNLRAVYDELWDKLSPAVTEADINAKWLKKNSDKFSLVISSIPKNATCEQLAMGHFFESQRIKIHNECILSTKDDNTIWYDGTEDRSWYRASRIFGTGSMEWGATANPPFPNLVTVRKPVRTNCNCHEDIGNLVHVGRFGKWKKGELTHNAFEDTLAALFDRDLAELRFK